MTTQIVGFKCPNCGAAIPFDSHSQTLKCQHCGTEFDIENLQSMQAEENIASDSYNWNTENTEQIFADGKVTYVCPSCGGEVVGDESMSASVCPYCGNSTIVAKQFEGMLKPDLVVPFKYSKEDAKKAFMDYLGGKKLLSKDFALKNVINKLNGMYVPYWLFSCNADCAARFRATRVNSYQSNDYIVTETDHFLVFRDGNIDFENVPVDGSSKLTPELLESLEPFDFSKAVDFNTAYLSGFFADKYDEDSDTAVNRANERIRNSMIQEISATTGPYSSCIMESANIRFSDGIRHYALLPIYVFSTTYEGKTYTFAMNGQTGKFSGNLPADKKRTTGYGLGIFLVVFVIIFLIMWLFVK